MSHKNAAPLIAKLQQDPSDVWQAALNDLDEAKRSYDPKTQTNPFARKGGMAKTYLYTGSGKATLFADEGKS